MLTAQSGSSDSSVQLPGPFFSLFDLGHSGLLPPEWPEKVADLSRSHALFVHLDGRSPTSLEPPDTDGFEYHVVTGDVIEARLPWLFELYYERLPTLLSTLLGTSLVPSPDRKSAININMLEGIGSRYEWHIDSNPVTGILFATTHAPGHGGELALGQEGRIGIIHPIAGQLAIFEAGHIPHAVLPLLTQTTRVSIPMIFYRDKEQALWEADHLNDYLYGGN